MKPTRSLSVVVLLTALAGCAMQNVDSGIGDEDVLGLLGDDDTGDDSKMDAATADMDSGTTNPGDDTGSTGTPDTGLSSASDGRVSGSDAGADRPASDTGVTHVDAGVDTGVVSFPDVQVARDVGPPDTGVVSVDPCSAATACGGCTAMGACGWCATTNRCQTGSATGPTGSTCGSWAWTTSMCATAADPCASSTGCVSCTGRSGCGWCGDGDTCMTGNSDGPNVGYCFDWYWHNVLGLFCSPF